jgi:hypothetical protein
MTAFAIRFRLFTFHAGCGSQSQSVPSDSSRVVGLRREVMNQLLSDLLRCRLVLIYPTGLESFWRDEVRIPVDLGTQFHSMWALDSV